MTLQAMIIQLPKIADPRGNLTFLQPGDQFPFEIQRVFWTYDVPGGETRGGHAYRQQHEIIVALSGSFDVVVTDATGRQAKFPLNRSYVGLWVPPLTWRHMENFSTNSLSLHLSSMEFQADDYIRNYSEYSQLAGDRNKN